MNLRWICERIYVILEVDGGGGALVRADDGVAVRRLERVRRVEPRAAREGDARAAGGRLVGEDAVHDDAADERLQLRARRRAGHGKDLGERAPAGAGRHHRDGDVDGQRGEDEVAARREALQQARRQRRLAGPAGFAATDRVVLLRRRHDKSTTSWLAGCTRC